MFLPLVRLVQADLPAGVRSFKLVVSCCRFREHEVKLPAPAARSHGADIDQDQVTARRIRRSQFRLRRNDTLSGIVEFGEKLALLLPTWPLCVIRTRVHGSRVRSSPFRDQQRHEPLVVDFDAVGPDIVAGEVDAVPAERRQVRQQGRIGSVAAALKLGDGAAEIAAVEQDDRRGDE